MLSRCHQHREEATQTSPQQWPDPAPPLLRPVPDLGVCSKQEIRALKKQRLKELERKRKAKAKAKASETPEEKIGRRLAKKVCSVVGTMRKSFPLCLPSPRHLLF